jgi:hypothetical protein
MGADYAKHNRATKLWHRHAVYTKITWIACYQTFKRLIWHHCASYNVIIDICHYVVNRSRH